MSGSYNEKDAFWDIAKLVPKHSDRTLKNQTVSPKAREVRTVEYSIGNTQSQNKDCELNLADYSKSDVGSFTYIPKNRFVESVTVTGASDRFDFYGYFRKAAEVYYDFKMPRCDFVPFYSYMPQYSQFTSQQKAFYFFWRDEVRHGRFIKTDYSYIYLYAYEILNLSDKIGTDEALNMLVSVWCAYRSEYPKLDDKFVPWVRDFCLVNRLDAPMDKIGSFIFDIIGKSDFPEFYISGIDTPHGVPAKVITSYLSDYDWRCGKYAEGEWSEIYKSLMEGAMEEFISALWTEGRVGAHSGEVTTYSSSAFQGALCTHKLKKHLKVVYYPISHSKELCATVTSAVRYTENKLRGLIGIKSRLTVKDFSDRYKRIIDAYFDTVIRKRTEAARVASLPEYERLYDSVSTEASASAAAIIERSSWSTTARLVADSYDDEIAADDAFSEPQISEAVPGAEDVSLSYGLCKQDIIMISSLLDGAILKDSSVAERINEAFSDGFGDVILEYDGDSYYLIDDYKDDITEWISKLGL